jgi:V/A-type H+-transporting ATPase subunit C
LAKIFIFLSVFIPNHLKYCQGGFATVTAALLIFAGVKSYSLRGKLLTKKDLQMLAESRDLDELVTRIKNTAYADVISKVQKPYTAQKIELALRDRQADLHHMMMQALGGSKLIFAYYLKFILRNLKMIIKGKILGRSQEEIETALSLHAEELIKERDIILKALVAKDATEAISTLRGIGIGNEVEKAFSAYNEKKQIQILDLYFDKFFYEELSRTITTSADFGVRALCGKEIDFYNILSILRAKFWGLDENQIQSLIVPYTGTSSKELLTRMVSADSVKSALNELASTPYKDLIPQQDNAIDAINQFENSFDRLIHDGMQKAFVRMFSYSTVVAIVRLIEYEVRNLSSITFAVEQKISPDVTMSKLILKER